MQWIPVKSPQKCQKSTLRLILSGIDPLQAHLDQNLTFDPPSLWSWSSVQWFVCDPYEVHTVLWRMKKLKNRFTNSGLRILLPWHPTEFPESKNWNIYVLGFVIFYDLANGHAQNALDQKSDTTSEDQLFITRNFVFGPEKIPSLSRS